MATLIENGYPIFTDSNGDPLESGYIFIGVAGLNPISNPLQAYWDADLTIPATNIRTSEGYPVYNGSPGRLYVEANYSVLVQDKDRNTVYMLIDALNYFNTPSSNPGFDGSEVVVKDADEVTVKQHSFVDVDGVLVTVYVDTDLTIPLADTNYYISLTPLGVLSIQTGSGTFDVEKGGLYDGDNRILNWVVYRTGGIAYAVRILDTQTLVAMDQSLRKDKGIEVLKITTPTVSTERITGEDFTGILEISALSDINLITGAYSLTTGASTAFDVDETTLTLNRDLTIPSGDLAITSGGINTDGNALRTKIVNIGDWNMDSTASVQVTHGISDFTKIRDVSVTVRNDADTSLYPLDYAITTGVSAGFWNTNSVYVNVFRIATEWFDSTDFDSTSYNRGWITIVYEA